VVGVGLVIRKRSRLARVAAPAAFLVAATIAIMVVRSALSEEATSTQPPGKARQTPAAPSPARTGRGGTASPRREFYVIRAGDTLDSVAIRHGTTVQRLLVLNPDLDPVALRIGQRIRVA
jgi:LysM repeat protein